MCSVFPGVLGSAGKSQKPLGGSPNACALEHCSLLSHAGVAHATAPGEQRVHTRGLLLLYIYSIQIYVPGAVARLVVITVGMNDSVSFSRPSDCRAELISVCTGK